MRQLNTKKGVTVIEVLVSLLIVAIIFGMVASIVMFFANFFGDESQYVDRQENMRIVMLQLERDIRMSDQLVDLSTAPCFRIGNATAGTATLMHTYCFHSDSNTISRNNIVVARSVQAFTIRLVNTNELLVEIQMLAGSNRRQLEAELRIFLRQ